MNNSLRYYMHDGPSAFRFELSGDLTDEGALRLERDWRTASSVIGNRQLIVDMTFVTAVGAAGHTLLGRWHSQGARLIAASKSSRALAESITGEPLAEPAASGGRQSLFDRTWMPFPSASLARAATLLVLATVMFPVEGYAATLEPRTVAAWDDYLRTEEANLQQRAHSDSSFLWTFEDAERAAKVRSGEIVVAPAPGQVPRKVPGGLIHHWIGAAFLPGVKLDDILDVTRNYDRYREFYRPFVVESRAISRGDSGDRFSMLLMNKALFLTMAFDVESQATTVRLDDRRAYAISKSTRIQEVEEYGRLEECRKREGEGGGYIWKLYSIARFEQRSDGVIVELEAIALSRDVPAAVHLVVDPIVRRLSRNSLLVTLQQTSQAMGSRPVDISRMAGTPPSAGKAKQLPSPVSNRSSSFAGVH